MIRKTGGRKWLIGWMLLSGFCLQSLAQSRPVSVTNRFSVSHMFGHGMVLQCGQEVPVFGTAEDGKIITVNFSGQEKTTVAREGQWIIYLDELTPDWNGQVLSVQCDGAAVSFTNVVVGEVWFAGGQSNMALSLWYAEHLPSANTHFPNVKSGRIRRFAVNRTTDPGSTDIGTWSEVTVENAGKMSAVCYYFAENLSAAINVPVGMIECYWGGTKIESWMHPELFYRNTAFSYATEARDAKQTLTPNDGNSTERNIPGISGSSLDIRH